MLIWSVNSSSRMWKIRILISWSRKRIAMYYRNWSNWSDDPCDHLLVTHLLHCLITLMYSRRCSPINYSSSKLSEELTSTSLLPETSAFGGNFLKWKYCLVTEEFNEYSSCLSLKSRHQNVLTHPQILWCNLAYIHIIIYKKEPALKSISSFLQIV